MTLISVILCVATVLNATFFPQKGPTCMVAAARMVISAHEPPPSHRDLSRALPIWPDGVHAYDLTRELERRGWSALIFTGPPEAIARLIEAGFGVIAMVKSDRGRHSVAVTGAERSPDSNSPNSNSPDSNSPDSNSPDSNSPDSNSPDSNSPTQCGRALYKLLVSDPNRDRARWLTAREFEALQSEQQAIVIFKPTQRDQLGARGFPTAVAQRLDRRFRAQTMYERSQKHTRPNAQQRALLIKAVHHDPCYPPPREALNHLERQLKVAPSDLPTCVTP